jgi:hypothetical protein
MPTVPDVGPTGKHLFDLLLDDVRTFVLGYTRTTNSRSKELIQMAAIAWGRIEERTGDRVARRAPLQLVTAPPSRRRPSAATYRRRRLAALVVVAALALAAVQVARHALFQSVAAGAAPVGPTVLVAEQGDSYWSLAAQVSPGGDLRSTVDELVDANGGGDLHVGDRIVLPD